jgi:hypothetical protein
MLAFGIKDTVCGAHCQPLTVPDSGDAQSFKTSGSNALYKTAGVLRCCNKVQGHTFSEVTEDNVYKWEATFRPRM